MARITDYAGKDGVELGELVARGEASPSEIVDAALEAIAAANPQLNAIVTLMEREAREQAEACRPGSSPLAGVPIVLKDEYQFYAGAPTSSASRLAQGMTTDYDTELVRRFRRAGIIVLGKSNLPELGASVATEPVLNGICRNPWSLAHGVGGSSGGSACAVAAGMVPIAYANDGAGSIRIPASANGIFGLKPNRARVPCGPDASELWNGLVIEGGVSRTVRDSAAMLDAIEGADQGAPYFAPPKALSYLEETRRDPGRLRIAFTATPPFETEVDADCVAAVHDAAKLCESLGHDVIEAAPRFDGSAMVEGIKKLLAIHLSLAIDELSAQTGRPADAAHVERNHLAIHRWGAGLKATDMLSTLNLFGRISRQVAPFFDRYDVLLTPTLALPPRPHGWVAVNSDQYDHEEYLRRFFAFVPFTPIANVTGQPAMTVPTWWNAAGLPIGTHYIAPVGREDLLFRLAAQLEQARPWADRRPPHGYRG